MNNRKISTLLVSLLVALPLLGAFPNQVSATSSRVAVVKEVKGTAKVQKAGGSKEFTAFAKMTINEGDILATGAGSSVILKFRNGQSDDDLMTVAPGSTLSFDKLSDSKGTRTKISLRKGSVWVEVKSITSTDDKYELETPTAAMGVRGTSFFAAYDPSINAAQLLTTDGAVGVDVWPRPGSDPVDGYLYPAQWGVYAGGDGENIGKMSTVNLDIFSGAADPVILRSILRQAQQIISKNISFVTTMDSRKEQSSAEFPGLPEQSELRDQYVYNVKHLLDLIARAAIDSGKLSEKQIIEIENEISAETGNVFSFDKTVSIQLTDTELKEQGEMLKLLVDLQKNKQTDSTTSGYGNKELVRKLLEQRNLQKQMNESAREQRFKKVEDEYIKQLADNDKTRFLQDKRNLNQ
ncbi:FecR family protein [Cohnella silvisoli]|uniref:FecR family protein n=1 Tax=Cohnella silvisoli TaxID=2873699 RepID=A0ABV1KP86_9BACL|nr:FecR family protein [Cohnella silvisoli]MCD9025620.1 FecR domain-containing protein [Cohnella silvisoli]